MNNRIFELAKQADLIQWDALPSGAITPDHASVAKARKFAELIVKECADVGSQWADGLIDSKHYVFVNKKIKQHFGVEE
jgi:hypothetical protein